MDKLTKKEIESRHSGFQTHNKDKGSLDSLLVAAEKETQQRFDLPSFSVRLYPGGGNRLFANMSLCGSAAVKQFARGVTIWYRPDLAEMTKWLAVTHELGHVLLHFDYTDPAHPTPGHDKPGLAPGSFREVTASFFAELATMCNPSFNDKDADVLYELNAMHKNYSEQKEWLLNV